MVSYLATATIAASLLAATPEAPQWESDYGKALAATRADDRPLLVVLDYAQSPAQASEEANVQQVSRTSHTEAVPEAELLSPYRLCKVDVSTDYGKRVAQAFGASSFPYTAIIDKTGSVIIYSNNGTLDAESWKATLTTYKSGDRTESLVMTSHANTSNVVFRKSFQSQAEPYCESCQRGYCPTCQQQQGY
jgi:hypothetical protein